MKKMTLLFLPLFFIQGGFDPGNVPLINKDKDKGFAVVELFTSEGCSSCPPAEETVGHISHLYETNVYVLSFHVDYWDRLGWKDPFSDANHTKRQQRYGEAFHLRSVYTPQVILNGRAELIGSDENKMRDAIGKELANTPGEDFELSVKNIEGNTIAVAYKRKSNDDLNLYMALVQTQAVSDVKKGENAGKQLQHCNVVRDFKTFYKSSGTGHLKIPEGLAAKDCRVIAFLQGVNNGGITGAKELRIP
jgi:hypothetical protein